MVSTIISTSTVVFITTKSFAVGFHIIIISAKASFNIIMGITNKFK
jgi:hypothetical protein